MEISTPRKVLALKLDCDDTYKIVALLYHYLSFEIIIHFNP